MEKKETTEIQVDSETERRAEKVLEELGIPVSVAVDMYFRQIALTRGIPFPVRLPGPPIGPGHGRIPPEDMRGRLDRGCGAPDAGTLDGGAPFGGPEGGRG